MRKLTHFKKEVILLSLILFFIAIIVRQGDKLVDSRINRLAFPLNTSIFENFKVFFTTISLLILSEYFFSFDLPNNYLLSRVIGVLFMMISSMILFFTIHFLFNIHITILITYGIYLISIVLGQYISYLIQKQKELEISFLIGIAQYFLLASFIIIITSLTPLGILFQAL